MVQSCDNILVLFMGVYEERDFRTFDLIDDGDVFIIIFEAIDPVINNREDLHKKSSKKSDF